MSNIVLSTEGKLVAGPRPRASADTSDKVLIGRIAQGDQAAMRVLFARHNVRLFRFLLRLVGNEAIAEELLNEVFIEAWRHADRFAARSEVSTWLLAIARHKAVSVLRRRSSKQLDDDTAETIADPADGPDAALQKAEIAELLRDCLKRLSPSHREIIDLVYYHERTIDDVAQILAIPLNTVKTRLFHARKGIARTLAARGVDRHILERSVA